MSTGTMITHRDRQPRVLHDTPPSLAKSRSEPLPASARTTFDQRFHHSFADVRVHTDAHAHEAAKELEARAFTIGRDVYFREGAYDVHGREGTRTLAHELTHVVQNHRAGIDEAPNDGPLAIAPRESASEREAESAADFEMAAAPNAISSAPATSGIAVAQRWPWDDDSGGGGGILDTLSSIGSSAVNTVSNAASNVVDTVSTEAKSIYGEVDKGEGVAAASKGAIGSLIDTVGGDYKSGNLGLGTVGRAVQGEVDREKKAGSIFENIQGLYDKAYDWGEDKAKGGIDWATGQAKGIPILEDVAGGVGDVAKFGVDFAGGFGKAATGAVTGIGRMAENPIGTLQGLNAMVNSTAGGYVANKAKGDAWDALAGQKSLGDAASDLFSMKTLSGAWDSQVNLDKALAGNYIKSYEQGKYGEMAGRATFDIGSVVLGAQGLVGEAGEAGQVSKAGAIVDAGDAGAAAGNIPRAPMPTIPMEPVPPTIPQPSLPFRPTVPMEPIPSTTPGMPTFPGVGPGRTPTLPGVAPPAVEPIPPTTPNPSSLPYRPTIPPEAGPPSLPPDTIPGFPAIPRGTPGIEQLAKVVGMNPGMSVVELLMKMGRPISWIT